MIQLFLVLDTFSAPHKFLQFGVSHYTNIIFLMTTILCVSKKSTQDVYAYDHIKIQHLKRESFSETNWNTKLLILFVSYCPVDDNLRCVI